MIGEQPVASFSENASATAPPPVPPPEEGCAVEVVATAVISLLLPDASCALLSVTGGAVPVVALSAVGSLVSAVSEPMQMGLVSHSS